MLSITTCVKGKFWQMNMSTYSLLFHDRQTDRFIKRMVSVFI